MATAATPRAAAADAAGSADDAAPPPPELGDVSKSRRKRAPLIPRTVLFTLIAIYAVAFLHGVARSSCDCPEPPDSVLVPASVDPSTFTRCVLYDPPTRARLHSRLAQCVGLTRWKIPPLPQQQPAPWEGGGAA